MSYTTPDLEVARHLEAMHGYDIGAEWHHAPDQYRRNCLSEAALEARHNEAHADDEDGCYVWNEASERHTHHARQPLADHHRSLAAEARTHAAAARAAGLADEAERWEAEARTRDEYAGLVVG